MKSKVLLVILFSLVCQCAEQEPGPSIKLLKKMYDYSNANVFCNSFDGLKLAVVNDDNWNAALAVMEESGCDLAWIGSQPVNGDEKLGACSSCEFGFENCEYESNSNRPRSSR